MRFKNLYGSIPIVQVDKYRARRIYYGRMIRMSGAKIKEKYEVVRTSLYEQIADMLKEIIIQENFKENEKLPSEQTLAEKFGVSRNVVREALKLLKERGLVDLRNGTGSYVKKPEASNLSNIVSCIVAMDDIDFKDIYDIRIILETASAEMAASRVTREQLDHMQALLDRLNDRSITVKERRECDINFHTAIAEAAGNTLLVVFIQTMRILFMDMIEKGIFIEGGIADASLRHQRIFDALEKRDPRSAKNMMYEHLAASRDNVENFQKDNAMAKLLEEQHKKEVEEILAWGKDGLGKGSI